MDVNHVCEDEEAGDGGKQIASGANLVKNKNFVETSFLKLI